MSYSESSHTKLTMYLFFVRLVERIFETNSGVYSDRSGVAADRLQSNYTPGVPWLTDVPGLTS